MKVGMSHGQDKQQNTSAHWLCDLQKTKCGTPHQDPTPCRHVAFISVEGE